MCVRKGGGNWTVCTQCKESYFFKQKVWTSTFERMDNRPTILLPLNNSKPLVHYSAIQHLFQWRWYLQDLHREANPGQQLYILSKEKVGIRLEQKVPPCCLSFIAINFWRQCFSSKMVKLYKIIICFVQCTQTLLPYSGKFRYFCGWSWQSGIPL